MNILAHRKYTKWIYERVNEIKFSSSGHYFGIFPFIFVQSLWAILLVNEFQKLWLLLQRDGEPQIGGGGRATWRAICFHALLCATLVAPRAKTRLSTRVPRDHFNCWCPKFYVCDNGRSGIIKKWVMWFTPWIFF